MSGAGERPRTRISGTTRVVGVIGWPVSGSLSPVIHNTAFIAMNLDWVYVALPVPPGRLREALAGLPAAGLVGANVTMPHKSESALLADERSEDAERLRAVNTLVFGDGALVGHNTDAPGFDRFLRGDAGFDPAGRTALVFGAGGAARACALAMARAGLETIVVAARDPTKVDEVRATLEGSATRVGTVPFGEAAEVAADVVVNATPLGGQGEVIPLPRVVPGGLVVDLLTRPAVTPLMAAARAAGVRTYGGLGLLLHQATLSFELWTGRLPPLPAMSAAALAVLAEDEPGPSAPAG